MLITRHCKGVILFICLYSLLACEQRPDANTFNRQIVEELHASISSIYPKNLYIQYSMEGKSLRDSTFITDINGNSKQLKDVIDSHRLVLRFSDINCNTCVEQEINNLRKFFSSPKNKSIMILATYRSMADLLKFKRINAIEFELYTISENQLPLLGEQISAPYMFVIDESLQVKFPFIPSKEFPDCSLSYYKALLESNIF